MDIISRKAATQLGLLHYFTGRVCKNGHIDRRLVSSKGCLSCIGAAKARFRNKFTAAEFAAKTREYGERYEAKDPVRRRLQKGAAVARLLERDPTYHRRQVNAWNKRNPERIKAIRRRAWVKSYYGNPERTKLRNAARLAGVRARAAGLITGGGLTKIITAIFERQKGKCAACQRRRQLELDHRVPLADGGTNDASNLQWLCGPCNREKASKDPIKWARSHGRLL